MLIQITSADYQLQSILEVCDIDCIYYGYEDWDMDDNYGYECFMSVSSLDEALSRIQYPQIILRRLPSTSFQHGIEIDMEIELYNAPK